MTHERFLNASLLTKPPANRAMTPADKLWLTAHNAGVAVCFANPGTTEMWLVDGLNRSEIRAVLGLHETVCAGAADAYGRLTRKPASILLHLGPGLANALSNLHNARRASTPLLNIVGSMASWHEATDPLLNMNTIALAESVSRFVSMVSSADGLEDDVRRACVATQSSDQAGGSKISTVIVPHDHTWPQDAETTTGALSRGHPFDICSSHKAVANSYCADQQCLTLRSCFLSHYCLHEQQHKQGSDLPLLA